MKDRNTNNSNRLSFEQGIEYVAQSHQINYQLVYDKVKEALQKAYVAEINPENSLIIEELPDSSVFLLFEELTVVKEITNPYLEISLLDAKKIDATVTVGDVVKKPVPISAFSYFAIQKVSQIIRHFLNVSESEKIYNEFIGKKGGILSGTIENFDHRYFSVNIGKIFAFIPKEEQITSEYLTRGDRVKFYVKNVFLNHHFGQVMGSRKCPEFLEKLFALEIPEVGSGVIKIKKIVREPGIRSKVALLCHDESIDPVGSCIGRGGNRIKSISRELRGEKIDIFLWDDDPRRLVINAASPSKIVNIEFLPEKKIRLIVLQVQYPIAIGREGVAVRLLSEMTGYDIDIHPFETYIESVDNLVLNGNLSYIDLEKLEVDATLLSKCIDPRKETK